MCYKTSGFTSRTLRDIVTRITAAIIMSNPSAPAHKPQNIRALRRELGAKRRALSTKQQRLHALGLAQQFARSPWSWRSGNVASYLAGNGELDPVLINQHCQVTLRTLAVPVVRAQQLEFFQIEEHTRFTQNRFGLREPDSGAKFVDTRSISIMLLPLVGFDEAGNRLGMGGGFYDRHLGNLPPSLRPTLIGVGHECQRVEALEAQPWDIPLDGLLTEQRWQLF